MNIDILFCLLFALDSNKSFSIAQEDYDEHDVTDDANPQFYEDL